MIDINNLKIIRVDRQENCPYQDSPIYHEDYYLKYENKKVRIYDNRGFSEKQLAEVLGVPITTKIRSELFKFNPTMFYKIEDMHPELKELAMGITLEDKLELIKLKEKAQEATREFNKKYSEVYKL